MNTSNALEWLKGHWFLIAALVTIGIAWGTIVAQVSTLDKDVNTLKDAREEVHTLRRSTDRLDERTIMMQQSLHRIEGYLMRMETEMKEGRGE